jgi:hypothetical protein
VRKVLVVAALSLLIPAQAQARAETEQIVVHNRTHTEFFPDDICGPRASTVVFRLRTEVDHVTEHPDGSFSATFIETGTYTVDFVNPALSDQKSQFTGAVHFTFTPGETFVFSESFHDFPTGLRIWFRAKLVEVHGRTVVDRVIEKVTGCP